MSESHVKEAPLIISPQTSLVVDTQPPAYLQTDPDERAPWLPMPNESPLWYERFTIYRLLGPSRTVLEAYRQMMIDQGRVDKDSAAELEKPTGSWYPTANRDRWKDRALAWDVHLWTGKWQEDEAYLIQSMKQLRLYAGARTIAKALEVVELVKPEKESLGAAAAALKSMMRETREDLEGSGRHDRLDVAVLVGELPGDVLARLKKHTDSK